MARHKHRLKAMTVSVDKRTRNMRAWQAYSSPSITADGLRSVHLPFFFPNTTSLRCRHLTTAFESGRVRSKVEARLNTAFPTCGHTIRKWYRLCVHWYLEDIYKAYETLAANMLEEYMNDAILLSQEEW